MVKYELKWEVFHKTEVKECPTLEDLEDQYLYCLAHEESREIFKIEGLEKAQERLRLGIQEEMEEAKGNYETPPRNDVFGNGVAQFNQMVGNFK